MATTKPRGRVSTAAMKPNQQTREQIIATYVFSGMTNDQIYSAFEAQYPALIKADDPRRIAGLVKEPFDAEERGKFQRAVRSVRGLAQKSDKDNSELLEILGEGETRPATEVDYENIKRFQVGDPVMEWMYGTTSYRWLLPESLKGKDNPATGAKWEYGDLVPKAMLPYLDPLTGLPGDEKLNAVLHQVAFGDKTGHVEEGLPEGMVAVLGGAQGTGKSRLSIEIEKAACAVHDQRIVLHNYGESNMGQLRQWIGPKAPKNMIIGERKSLAQIVADIYRYQPIIYVQDSLQTILETQTSRGMKEVMATFKQIATEKRAGRPHIILLSQLNKQGKLKGPNEIGHIADVVFDATPIPTRKSVFSLASSKNRGGEVPRTATYQHTEDGVVCLGQGSKNKPTVNLVAKTDPIIARGISNPAALPDDGGEDIV
jgi:hypothetical protein